MHFPAVNLKFLPLKGHFFFCHGGSSPFTPFLTSIAKQRGYSATLVGIVFSVMPIFAVLSRPVFGAITDRFRCQKKVFLCSIVVLILITASYGFLPDSPANIDNGDDMAALATHQFWLFFLFLAIRNVSLNIVTTLSETMCLQNLGKDTHLFGKQRLWGCLGWGMISLLTGWLIDWYSEGKLTKDYTPGLVVSIALLVATFLNAFLINDCQSDVTPKHMIKDIKIVLNDYKVVIFLIYIVFFGIFYGSISLYLLWHIEELVTKYHPEIYSSTKTIQGTIIAVKCFAGETPFFYLSGIIIKKVGHLNSMIIGLTTLSVRLFLYSILKNPLWVIPVEILSGLGYALPYSAMTSYAAIIAPESLKATVQGLFGIVFQGIGVCLGSLITGVLFNKIGSSETYFVLSILALIVCVLQILTIRIMMHKKKSEK